MTVVPSATLGRDDCAGRKCGVADFVNFAGHSAEQIYASWSMQTVSPGFGATSEYLTR